jgi:sorbitol-specific phosphotransferase system component IIC
MARGLRFLFDRIRRNHALEHATINLLTHRYPGAQMMGLSNPGGFTLYTSLDPEQVKRTVPQALASLQHGLTDLVYHENCGTNLVMTATLTTAATLVGFQAHRRLTVRRFVEFLPQAVLLNVVALLIAAPISRWVQTHVTTMRDLADVEIVSMQADRQGTLQRVRVRTRTRQV